MRKPEIFQLSVAAAFKGLSSKEKLYAHHTARAAWHGARIILRQVSPEANDIFDFIMALYHSCDGQWEQLARRAQVDMAEVEKFLDYAAVFLSNIGNYFGSGDQKFHPDISPDELKKLADCDPTTAQIFSKLRDALFRPLPDSLGVPSDTSQSTYYLGDETLTDMEEVSAISKLMESSKIFPENTRLRKSVTTEGEITLRTYDILQASIEEDEATLQEPDDHSPNGTRIRLVRGDHKEELKKINQSLEEAVNYAANWQQQKLLAGIAESFSSGDLNAYRKAQRVWVKDKAPEVETVFGFVEPYRDPLGVRAEFEGIVGIADSERTKVLRRLAEIASDIIPQLPWAQGYEENNGKGPFEKELFDIPDFASVQILAYCSSLVFPGINLPNYNDIRQEDGFKNIIFANRMIAESKRARGIHMIYESERKIFQEHRFTAYYIWVVLHEILGHGTSKLLQEHSQGYFNFDREHPPLNPLTGKPIDSWYGPGETWTGVFADLSTTVDECRAELVGAYLIDVPEILELFGCTADSEIKPADVVYNLYQQLGVDGLRALENYNPSTKKWGQAHSRAHFGMLQHMLRDSSGLYKIIHDKESQNLTVQVNRSLLQEGKASLGRMLLRLHVYRCTADIRSCREFYEDLTTVNEEALGWRKVVLMKKDPPLAFCHANTFLDGDSVVLKEYEPTVSGLIQSWAERDV
ncbi:dipeptidyl peptidase III [Aspergillus lentulus]|uniref:Dipeptidyl peptidase 3 n=1 Tax=Aspergillus lentulus TaxID=293939 RepID=A0ABQ0ZU99_ASPLE|nr:dipeptidyl peptidase III [Aspergillus lentulus]GFF48981.1 dipeptidyl peptidase III [Aspergillus lentulus]GFF61753.1 dipeptidyl peptidase III [Aspergillus lentulus]GFF64842.1 dipeptidyl peptidase III [Aspergillus lentulus]GFF94841.1 dipeptidyl peptidase III [Aspergillus lentulus]